METLEVEKQWVMNRRYKVAWKEWSFGVETESKKVYRTNDW